MTYDEKICDERHQRLDSILDKWESRLWAVLLSVIATLFTGILSLGIQVYQLKAVSEIKKEVVEWSIHTNVKVARAKLP